LQQENNPKKPPFVLYLESYKFEKPVYMFRGFVMTCYFRHLKQVFEKAGIEVTSENKREIDRVIHGIE